MKTLGKTLLWFAALVAGFFAIDYQQSHKIRSFCSGIVPSTPIGDVVESAHNAGFWILGDTYETGNLGVLNHKMFIFSYACEISYVDRKVTETKFMAAD